MTMEAHDKDGKNMTISDVAMALGVSKTTVSRAISGKGRIGKQTRQKVMDYIKEHHYQPSAIAKGLAQNKTYNIGLVISPADDEKEESSLYRCLLEISEEAEKTDYNLIVCTVKGNGIRVIQKLVHGHKVDGVILGKKENSEEIRSYLTGRQLPFVSMKDEAMPHSGAGTELSRRLLDLIEEE